MKIDYHDIYYQQFEDLTVAICKKILGIATQKFSFGADGGRDGRFRGKASNFPNSKHPNSGLFIIQAKHTDNPVAKMSDKDFFSDKNADCIINKELKRVKILVKKGEVDHYLFFTNRRDSANKISEIENKFLALGLKSATVYGVENIDMFLKQYPEALKIAAIDYLEKPLRLIPDELAEIILILKNEIKELTFDRSQAQNFNRTSFDKKCQSNNLTDNTKSFILKNYLKEFYKVDKFLANPSNEDLQELYIETAAEFNAEILERFDKKSKMDSILNELLKRLFYRDGDLNRNKSLTRTIIYYMFWKCDLGVNS